MTENKAAKLIKKASIYIDRKRFDKAARCLRAAYTENGKFNALIMYFLGMMHDKAGNYQESMQCLLNSVEYLKNPNNVISKTFEYKIFLHLAASTATAGLTKQALLFYDEAFRRCNPAERHGILIPYLYTMVSGNTSPEYMVKAMEKINGHLWQVGEMPEVEPEELPPEARGKIHLAYISPDFRSHVMYNFYYAMLKYYDRSKFYISCIYLKKEKDKRTEEVESMVDDFRYCHKMSHPQIAAMLKAMQVDIAIDLAGYTANSGLDMFRYRVAPVQISGLGWMESTGLMETDYLITDRRIDPPEQSYITEKPLYLSTCFCYIRQDDLPQSKGAPCKEKGYITFCTFNRVNKFTDPMLMAWREIFHRVPNSKLLLKGSAYRSDKTKFLIRDRLQKIGIDVERVMFEPSSKDYMERYLEADIALDTYPYCGGGTTCDALYMGVPVVSLYGKRRSSNFGRSILSAAGLGELAVNNADEYVNLAVSLANDWDTLDMLHKNLRSMLENSDLMNGEKYTRGLEAQYQEILKQKNAK